MDGGETGLCLSALFSYTKFYKMLEKSFEPHDSCQLLPLLSSTKRSFDRKGLKSGVTEHAVKSINKLVPYLVCMYMCSGNGLLINFVIITMNYYDG